MEFINNFHFLRPLFLLFLLLPILPYLRKKGREVLSDSPWAKVCDKNLLQFLLIKKNEASKKTASVLQFLIFLLLPLALAGPCWQKEENPALNVNNPLIFALNMSGDMWSKDVSPSRAVRAKFLIKDILKAIDSAETGLEVYSREPFMISPLSEDKNLIDNLLPAVTYDIMPENGDRLDRAIDLAVERLQGAHYGKGNIVVLTSDVGERFDLALESAAKAAAEGYIINVIDINSSKNSKLEMVAQKGRGSYLSYNENLAPLIRSINDISDKQFNLSENMQAVWVDNGWYLLFLPAFLLLWFFRRGVVFAFILCCFGMQSASAGWFLNDNQEAMQAFENGDFKAASQKFANQPWKAGAAYKSGDFNASAQIYSTLEGTENLYNYGNALAKSGKIKEAIEVYEKVLQAVPEHEDAKFNLEYLKQQQNQQQNSQNQQQKNDEQNQQNSQNNGGQSQNDEQNQNADKQQQEQSAGEGVQNEEQNKENNEENEQNKTEQQRQNSTRESVEQQAQKQENHQKMQESSQEAEDGENEQEVQSFAEGNEDKSIEEKQKIRARQYKFREIKEDKGGLLRALIKKEYNRQRYKE